MEEHVESRTVRGSLGTRGKHATTRLTPNGTSTAMARKQFQLTVRIIDRQLRTKFFVHCVMQARPHGNQKFERMTLSVL